VNQVVDLCGGFAVPVFPGSIFGRTPLGKDKTPMYEVDGFDNAVYLVKGSEVVAYR